MQLHNLQEERKKMRCYWKSKDTFIRVTSSLRGTGTLKSVGYRIYKCYNILKLILVCFVYSGTTNILCILKFKDPTVIYLCLLWQWWTDMGWKSSSNTSTVWCGARTGDSSPPCRTPPSPLTVAGVVCSGRVRWCWPMRSSDIFSLQVSCILFCIGPFYILWVMTMMQFSCYSLLPWEA